jgi:hypothetical protein
MSIFNRNKRAMIQTNGRPVAELVAPPKAPTSYIEIFTNKGNYHIRIRGGNNKIRFHGENMYSYSNAVRAAKLFSKETGLKVVNRSAK